jgi:hypothetical protein
MLLKRAQVQMLLGDIPGGVGLHVEHVLRVLDQCSHDGVEVRALGVGHGLNTLLPHRILLVTLMSPPLKRMVSPNQHCYRVPLLK